MLQERYSKRAPISTSSAPPSLQDRYVKQLDEGFELCYYYGLEDAHGPIVVQEFPDDSALVSMGVLIDDVE